MEDQGKTDEQIKDELLTVSQQLAELEELKAEHTRIVEQLEQARSELAIRVKVRTAEVTKANEELQKEITERRRAEEALNFRFELEKLIARVSTNFINLPVEKIDAEINQVLRLIGEFIKADRSYVFLASGNMSLADNTHEWCAEGIEPLLPKMQGVRVDNYPWWKKKLLNLESISIPRLGDFPPEASSEKALLQSQGVQSFIMVPLVCSGSVIGLLGIETVRAEHVWEEETITLLKIVSDIFVNALQRKDNEEEIIKREHFLSTIFDSIQDGLSILDMDLNVVRVNSTKEKWHAHNMPLVGKKCYQAFHNKNEVCDVCPTCQTIKNGTTSYAVVPKSDSDGQTVGWFEVYSYPLFDSANNQISGVIEYVRDITERKRASEELQESELRYRTTLDSMVAAIHVVDTDLRFILVNQAFKECNNELGLEVDAIGKKISEVFPFLTDKVYQEYRQVFDTGKGIVTEEVNTINGKEIITETRKIPVLRGDKVVQVITVIRNITEHKRTEDRIIKINECFLGFGNDPSENINRLTSLCGELLGADCALYNRLEGSRLHAKGLWHAPVDFSVLSEADGHICYDVIKQNSDAVMVVPNLDQTGYAQTDPNVNLYRLKTYIGRAVKLGGEYIGSLCVVYQHNFAPSEEDKRFLEIIAVAIGVEEGRKTAEDMLKENQARYRAIVEDQTELICRFLPDKTVTFVNEAVCRYLGKRQDEILGKNLMDFVSEEDRGEVEEAFNAIGLQNPVIIREYKIVVEGGQQRWLQYTSRGIFDNEGKLLEYQAVGHDITERKEAEKEKEALDKELMKSNKKMKQLALRDPHTGLYNHRYLEEVIEAEFYRARRYAHPISVLMLDIDYFKSINDVYGYQFGDLVIQQLSQQLKMMVRRYDIIIRFSGEEFIILCPGTERATALTLAQRLLDAFNLYNFGNKNHRVKLKISMAVASYPEDKIVKGIDLIELAEHMVSKIKEDGGNKVYSSMDVGKKKYPSLEKYEKGPAVNLLKKKIDKLNKQANQSLIEAIFAFAKTIEVKDHYTGEHVERTVHYAIEIARALNMSKDEIERIRQAAMLHDLGKIGISEKILLKRAKLTPKEFEIIKTHPQLGVDIIRPIQFLHAIIPLILYHHERWDGKGYPSGLREEDIPLGARIIAVADVYQALISDRPYRKAFPKSEVIKIMKEGAGTQFDPQIISVFLKILKQNHY